MTRIVAILIVALLGVAQARADALKLLAGQPGSDAYSLAGAVQRILEKRLPEHVLQVQQGGAVENIRAIEEGRTDFALTFSVVAVDAVEGRPPFKEKAQDLCHIATFLGNAFQIVVRAEGDLRSPADFKGKSAAFRPRSTVVEQVTRMVLEAHGLSYADFGRVVFGSIGDGVALMKEGEADIFTSAAALPSASVRSIGAARDIRLIGISDSMIARLQAINRGYRKMVIEAGVYAKQDEPVTTVGFTSHLVARCTLDEELVHAVARALVLEIAEVKAISREASRLTAAGLASEAGIPFHPGALRAFREMKVR